MGHNSAFILLGILLLCLLIFFMLKYITTKIQRKHEDIVRQKSYKLPQVQNINNKYQFYSIPEVVQLRLVCNSKQQFDRADLREYLISQISDNREYYLSLISKANKNKEYYQNYMREFSQIIQPTSQDEILYSTYSFFRSVEEGLINRQKMQPVLTPHIRITKSYVSPQGRNSYTSSADFAGDTIIACYNTSGQREIHRQTAQYQRGLMTDSLRYDVMKRDKFMCVICGATAQDGAKLHVDHILPVSKGGKTEINNLRTLCDHCNFGKKSKYDPNGLN